MNASLRRAGFFLPCLLLVYGAGAESLYSAESYRPLVSDNRAIRVGDALTVQVFENTSANTSVNTDTHRRSNSSASVQAGSSGVKPQFGLNASGDFDGGGRTQRTNKVLATLSVTVKEVLPNGDLFINGEQLLTINDEQQKVTLEGRVRPIDISDANVVLSTRIADARIYYQGEGDVSDRSRRSWLKRLLDAFGM
ncbi:flagellar basal body L-ring protein FlgH [Acidovorax facilis]|uniref:flagellar basal body L-ring protein FlgH n=1 Tax=Acidovorax facilis TaxID=12917 RepID=UPI003CEA915C